MPSKTDKQKNFFGAVMGAKKGQKNVSGSAKKVAKNMPKSQVKDMLKKEEDSEDESTDEAKRCQDEARCEVYGEPIKRERKWVNSQLLDDDEDAESISKKMKKDGKITVKGPEVKERKKFAPASQTHKPKKGKGSYDRKSKTFDENADIKGFVKEICAKNYAAADKYINNAIAKKIQTRIEKEFAKPLF